MRLSWRRAVDAFGGFEVALLPGRVRAGMTFFQPLVLNRRTGLRALLAAALLLTLAVSGAAALAAGPFQAPVADIAVTLAGPAEVAPGAVVRFVVSVANQGPQSAPEVALTQTVPAPLVVVTATEGAQAVTGGLRWQLADLAAGERRSVTVTVAVPAAAPVPDTVTLLVEARPAGDDPHLADNQAQLATALGGADLRASFEPAASEVRPGERLTHTIKLANVSNREAQGVVMTASLAAGTSWIDDDGPAGGFSREQVPGGVRWRRSALAGPSTHFIQLVTRVPLTAPVGSQVVHHVAVAADTLDNQCAE